MESSNVVDPRAMFSVEFAELAETVMNWFPHDVLTGIEVSEFGSWTVVNVPFCPAAISTLMLYNCVPSVYDASVTACDCTLWTLTV